MNSYKVSPSFRLAGKRPTKSSLIRNYWINWSALSLSEKVVCANIVLIPLWWISGLYAYWPFLIFLGIVCHDYSKYRRIQLRWPSFMVLSLLAFSTYQCVGLLFFALDTSIVSITAISRIWMFWFPPALILWYSQSNNIRVRLEVVAWSCTLLALTMLTFWIVGQGILGGGDYNPPRSLFSIVSGNASGDYASGKGLANYLIPYRNEEASIFGSARWNYFFVIPELGAVVSAFIALVALDISNNKWKFGLLLISAFLVLMSGTRSVWLGLPFIMMLRYSFTLGRARGYFIPLAAIALGSFIFLAFPSITDTLSNFYSQASDSVSSYRGPSTDVRGDIYAGTLEEIPNRLFFGHWVRGESVLPGSELARVGSHSFILGSLLYRAGLIGTLLFISFWISLAMELCKTSRSRPLFGLCTITLYTLLSLPMEFGVMPAVMIILLTTLVHRPVSSIQLSRVPYA